MFRFDARCNGILGQKCRGICFDVSHTGAILEPQPFDWKTITIQKFHEKRAEEE